MCIRDRPYYQNFQPRAEKIKDDLLEFLIDTKRSGKRVAAYGAAAKGNTLLNFSGIRSDLIAFVVDRNPAKQGKSMPDVYKRQVYLHSAPYRSEAEGAVNVCDVRLGITWPLPISEMSDRDRGHPSLADEFSGIVL